MKEVGTFADARDDLLYGSLSDESEVENNQAAPTGDAPNQESPSHEDKPAADSAAEDKAEEKRSEEKAETPSAEASKKEGEQPSASDDDPEIDLGDGVKMRLSELRQDYANRSAKEKELQAAATRKFQEAARMREEADSRVKDTRKLVSEIASDADMAEFVRAHPDALAYLIEQPEATRKLLGNPQAINDFWEDYETLKKNPRLAERFNQGDPEAQAALQAQQTRETINAIAVSLDNAVATVAQQYPDVDPAQVEAYLMELGGMAESADGEALAKGFARLYTLLFVNTKDGVRVDTKLIRDRFEYLASDARSKKERESKDAEQHNAEVDAELERERNAPPATPTGGAPTATAEKVKTFEKFEDAIQDLLYGEN